MVLMKFLYVSVPVFFLCSFHDTFYCDSFSLMGLFLAFLLTTTNSIPTLIPIRQPLPPGTQTHVSSSSKNSVVVARVKLN